MSMASPAMEKHGSTSTGYSVKQELTPDTVVANVEPQKIEVDVDEIFGPQNGDTVHYKSLRWWQCSFLMIAETISLGILSLPSVISTMGYIPGILLILGCGVIATYTGYIVGQFKQRYTNIHSFADAGRQIGGPVVDYIIAVMQILVFVFIMAAHVLAFSIMMNVMTNHRACTVLFAFIGTLISFILTIPRTCKNIATFSIFSCASIIIAVIVCMAAVAYHRPDPYTAVAVVSSNKTGLQAYSIGISNIIIAFTGHMAYFGFISELRKPADFAKSLALLQVIAITFYTVVAVVIYRYAGEHVASPALGSASPVMRKAAYGIAIPTIVVAGVVNANVCAKTIYVRFWKGTGTASQKNFKAWSSWIFILVVGWLIAFVIGNAIPVFNELLGILGALFCSWFSLGIPAWLWLYLNKGEYMKDWKKKLLTVINVCIFLSCVVICILGTYASICSILKSATTKKPFSCADNSI